MKGVLKLLRAQFRLHWVRMFLTMLALAISVMLVVWTIGSYDSLLNQSDHVVEECLGSFDLLVIGGGRQPRPLEAELVEKIKNDPQVEQCFAINSVNVSVQDLKRQGAGPCFPQLVGLIEGLQPFELAEGRLPKLDADEIVLSQTVADRRHLKLNDDILIEGPAGSFKLELVGLTRQSMMLFNSPGAYAHAPLVDQIAGRTQSPDTLYIKLKQGVAASKFAEQHKVTKSRPGMGKPGKAGPAGRGTNGRGRSRGMPGRDQNAMKVLSRDTITAQLGRGRAVSAMRMQGYFAASVATLAAMFIVFTTLSMGVSERSRQLAILRAIGLTRRQVVWLIFSESFVLAAFGWTIGLGLGVGLLKWMAAWKSDVFVNGIVITPQCLLLTLTAAVVGAGLAAVLPAFSATRLRPLDALSPRSMRPVSFKQILPISFVGLALLGIAPLIVFMLDIQAETRYKLYAFLGCPGGIIGFAMLTPLVILLSERFFVRPLGRLLHIESRLLKHQLSGNLWRSAGTCISLSTGLGLFVAIQTWGSSMLVPFLPGDGLPDAMVSVYPSGLNEKQVEELRRIDPIADDSCLPLAVEQVDLSTKTLDLPGFATVKQNNVLLIGFDAEQAIGGSSPVVGMTFVEGDRNEAVKKLTQGRYCIVPDHFSTQTGLHVGDRFGVVVPQEQGKDRRGSESVPKMIEYEIVGVVSIPGWHWVTKLSGMRKRQHKTLAAVFLGEAQTRRDYHLDRTSHFWMNLEEGVTPESLEAAVKPIAQKTTGTTLIVPLLGEITAFRPFVKVTDTREIDRMIRRRAASVLWMMSVFPLLTLMVTSLAVINTVVMSIRVRRWEFGILRSIGMTRSQQFRTVLGEALLIGLSACLLSFLFGLGAAWCATGICRYVFFFGGLTPPIVIPWLKLGIGFGTTLAICLAA